MNTVLDAYTTRSGRWTVQLIQIDANGSDQPEGPIWRCGCGAGSTRPLNNPLLTDPVGIVRAAAESHVNDCQA
ncbi:hypothetical protein ABH930_006388 [Kitasatospora sp. GAS204A]|uniref:hypothetical protein n=1 Tax=unclassified Kitasatospora TaxID=2633591 RepID=UPI002475C66D|nr:hypothetical protein [Kitasatospora sp. GAS204B]MDH6122020.1 hypothetical protein [Kitasatospora sp. GAS204B]